MAKPTPRKLEHFEAWLRRYGRGARTAALYVHDVRRAYTLGGPLGRLSDDELAPKTLRHILAACRAWAEHTDDGALLVDLKKVRLPPAVRQTAKVPLAREEWLELLAEFDRADYLSEPMRAQLALMGRRGFRCGDILRAQRVQVTAALKTGVFAYKAKGRRPIEFRVLETYQRYLQTLADHRGWSQVADLISPQSSCPDFARAAAHKATYRALSNCAGIVELEGVHPHRLRRTYATQFLKALKGDAEALPKLQQHMQWQSLSTALEYVDHDRGVELDQVAEGMFP